MPSDFETVRALRNDVALQIARRVERLGISQLAAAKQLDVPQPTLSKIVNGHTSGVSLELLLRVAVRAGVRMTLQVGLTPREAGAFISASPSPSARAFPSKIAADARASLKGSLRELTLAQRLEAFLEHNQLASELRETGRAAQAQHSPHAPVSR